jgi:hypothetical protein
VLRHLFDYLVERVENHQSGLHLLARYARRVEWFDQTKLHERYQADTRNGEAVYDADLRRFLFDQGLDMPFAQAKSASGLSDVLAAMHTADPLVAELKVFDGKDRGKRVLASGITQVSAYAEDYDKSVGYLVIVNLAEQSLALPSDGPQDRPPYLDVAGVRVYLVPVRALPAVSASKRGRTRPIAISRADLVSADGA